MERYTLTKDKTRGYATETVISRHEDLQEFYDYCAKPSITANGKESSREEDSEYFSFTGTHSFEEALELANKGWMKGLEDIKKADIGNKLDLLMGIDNKFDLIYDTQGSYVDIDRYLQGEPECMAEFDVKITPRFADIYVNMGFNAYVSSKSITERGKIILEFIDALEARNIKIKLHSCAFLSGNGRAFKLDDITVKDYKDALNIEAVNFAVCHPSFFRRLLFSYWENNTKEFRDKFDIWAGAGYGQTQSLDGSFAKDITNYIESQQNGNPYIYFDSVIDKGIDEAIKKVQEIINNTRK